MLGTNFIIPFWKIPTNRYCAALSRKTVLSSQRAEHQTAHLPGGQAARDTPDRRSYRRCCSLSAHSQVCMEGPLIFSKIKYPDPERDRKSQIMNRQCLYVSTIKHRSELLKPVGFLILRVGAVSLSETWATRHSVLQPFQRVFSKKEWNMSKTYSVISLLKFSGTH